MNDTLPLRRIIKDSPRSSNALSVCVSRFPTRDGSLIGENTHKWNSSSIVPRATAPLYSTATGNPLLAEPLLPQPFSPKAWHSFGCQEVLEMKRGGAIHSLAQRRVSLSPMNRPYQQSEALGVASFHATEKVHDSASRNGATRFIDLETGGADATQRVRSKEPNCIMRSPRR